MKRCTSGLISIAISLGAAACGGSPTPPLVPAPAEAPSALTAAEANAFVVRANAELREVWVASSYAQWDYMTNLTDENESKVSAAEAAVMAKLTELIGEAARFDGVEGLSDDTARQLKLLKGATVLPAPDDEAKRSELAELASKLGGMYGKGEYCIEDGSCRDLEELSAVLAESDDWDEQLEAWRGWRTVSPAMRPMYQRFVELGNEGSRGIGYSDMGELWRSGYDMPPAEVDKEADRLWTQVKPLYEQLHCLVRSELSEKYGADKVDPNGLIPAHITGNMWAQSWEGLYPLVAPYPDASSIDVTQALRDKGYDELKMVKQSEAFFTSMGLDPLPETFWERSMFLKPDDRDVVCHASAWDVDLNDDLRIKMCIKVDAEDFATLHHELGHNYYFHYYYMLPPLYQAGAHDGFHEAIGDSLVLSITPGYLQQIGLIDSYDESEESLINLQMMDALTKLAFLPFGRMIDQWRWDVFSGKITPETYNAGWWELREKYQGVGAPLERTEADFDPGAKYHIPGNTPYLRYFFAHILQFQFHKSMCEAAGHEGPLHTCSFYGSEEAGKRLQAMLELGASKPWPDALEAMTGEREMSAEPLVEYFTPLMTYLEEQNAERTCGW